MAKTNYEEEYFKINKNHNAVDLNIPNLSCFMPLQLTLQEKKL